MSLLFTSLSKQRVVITREAAIDDLPNWSTMCWVYPTDVTDTNRKDIFKKAHAKRVGTENGDRILVKQNYLNADFVQYVTTSFLTVNTWWCIATAVNASRGWIWSGKLDTTIAENTYSEQAQNVDPDVEPDDVDQQTNEQGDVLIGNVNSRWNHERGWPGRIACLRWWSATLTESEMKAEQFSFHPQRYADLEGHYHLGYHGREKVIDWSGNGRDGKLTH